MKLSYLLGEEVASLGWRLALSALLVLFMATLVAGDDPGVLGGVAAVLGLSVFGIHRALVRGRRRATLLAEPRTDIVVAQDVHDLTRDWWKDHIAGALYGLPAGVMLVTAILIPPEFAPGGKIPISLAAAISLLPPILLMREGTVRYFLHRRYDEFLRKGQPPMELEAPGEETIS